MEYLLFLKKEQTTKTDSPVALMKEETKEPKDGQFLQEDLVKKIISVTSELARAVHNFQQAFESGAIASTGQLSSSMEIVEAAFKAFSALRNGCGLQMELKKKAEQQATVLRAQNEKCKYKATSSASDSLIGIGPLKKIKEEASESKERSSSNLQESLNWHQPSKMTLELSEKYETLPEEFQIAIPKTHPLLETAMDIYEKYLSGVIFRPGSFEKDILSQITSESRSQQNLVCKFCLVELSSRQKLKQHMGTYHDPPYSNTKNFYWWAKSKKNQLYCPMGCGLAYGSQKTIVEHVVLFHSQMQMRNISREYCKFLLGWDYKQVDFSLQQLLEEEKAWGIKSHLKKSEDSEAPSSSEGQSKVIGKKRQVQPKNESPRSSKKKAKI